MAERGVAFVNLFNFRDLGGYPTMDGRSVRWRRLYRSDDLARLREGEDDQSRFAALGIRTVVDLRRPREIDEDGRIPDVLGPVDNVSTYHHVTYHHVHLPHPEWPQQDFTSTAERASFVQQRYLELSENAADGIGVALRLIADATAAPLVMHCAAGKDRTGVVSALTLALLGVDDDTIADDYQLSESAEPRSWAYYVRCHPDRQHRRWGPAVTVSPRAGMLGFLQDLRTEHGSVSAYAALVGVTAEHVAAMRAHLLTPLAPRS